ncbi:hypothetical protein OED52_15945 [Rhodococcus sp. Z13]|uniref:Uncharacterized protein n=1 Tax=Rhodococcus sacchari TaxID=2962047 RepID=A0ACD4DDL6_9NOCA|nr:hypothetical protein [Rhodococcus sp. Z13]UYP18141.1 hypothetical protein OED52_15945 [Rhodococcus sp. Z13]
MSFPAPPSGPGPAADRPVPADVTTAYQLWCAVLGLAIVSLLASLVDMWNRRGELVATMTDMVEQEALEGITTEQLESAVPVLLVITGAIGLVVVGLLYLVVRQLLRAKNWARMLLTLLGVFMSLTTLPTVFGVGVGDGGASWVLGMVGILQAVATVGAIVLMHRGEANRFFLHLPEDKPGQ